MPHQLIIGTRHDQDRDLGGADLGEALGANVVGECRPDLGNVGVEGLHWYVDVLFLERLVVLAFFVGWKGRRGRREREVCELFCHFGRRDVLHA